MLRGRRLIDLWSDCSCLSCSRCIFSLFFHVGWALSWLGCAIFVFPSCLLLTSRVFSGSRHSLSIWGRILPSISWFWQNIPGGGCFLSFRCSPVCRRFGFIGFRGSFWIVSRCSWCSSLLARLIWLIFVMVVRV